MGLISSLATAIQNSGNRLFSSIVSFCGLKAIACTGSWFCTISVFEIPSLPGVLVLQHLCHGFRHCTYKYVKVSFIFILYLIQNVDFKIYKDVNTDHDTLTWSISQLIILKVLINADQNEIEPAQGKESDKVNEDSINPATLRSALKESSCILIRKETPYLLNIKQAFKTSAQEEILFFEKLKKLKVCHSEKKITPLQENFNHVLKKIIKQLVT